MAGVAEIFFDTGILVAGNVDLGEASEIPLRLLDAVAEGEIERAMTAWHCCLELYSVTTRLPEEYRLPPEEALRFLREEILERFEVHDLPPGSREDFLGYLAAEGIVGGRIYDAYIGEVAFRAGARAVVTDNRRHFTPLMRHGVPVLTSRELWRRLNGSVAEEGLDPLGGG